VQGRDAAGQIVSVQISPDGSGARNPAFGVTPGQTGQPLADEIIGDAERRVVLAAADTADSRITIDRWNVPAGGKVDLDLAQGVLCWIELQSGEGRVDARLLDRHSLAMLSDGFKGHFRADADCELLVSTVPDAGRFDRAATAPSAIRVLD